MPVDNYPLLDFAKESFPASSFRDYDESTGEITMKAPAHPACMLKFVAAVSQMCLWEGYLELLLPMSLDIKGMSTMDFSLSDKVMKTQD